MLRLERAGIKMGKDATAPTEVAEDVLAGLYEQYYDKLVRYIFVRISDRAEAEDLAGEVFLRALKSLGSYRGRAEQMPAWLFQIAHNLVMDYLRKMSKRKMAPLDVAEIPGGLVVEEVVDRKMQMERVTQALKELTPAQREVIGLRFFAGLTSADVGQIMGKSAGAVREMQRAALETLRRQIHGGGEWREVQDG